MLQTLSLDEDRLASRSLQVLVLRDEDYLGDVELESGHDEDLAASALGAGHPTVVAEAGLALRTEEPARQVMLDLGLHPPHRVEKDGLGTQLETKIRGALKHLLGRQAPLRVGPRRGLSADVWQKVV